jgi:hypothetical protein
MLKRFLWRCIRWIGAAFLDQRFRQLEIQKEISRIHAGISITMPDNLILRGHKVYSQTDEDGIIAAIFENIPGGSFLEIGCGSGLENNTHALLLQGWRGVWVDGSSKNIAAIQREVPDSDVLLVEQLFVDASNVKSLIERSCRFLAVSELDFLSLDIDGNDIHVLRAGLSAYKPKVLCCEYNGKFMPPLRVAIAYNAKHSWEGDDYHGASLCAFVEALTDYTLITCNVSGSNAFFVRNDLAHHFTIYPQEQLFQPTRYHLSELASGHPASFKFLRDRLAAGHARKSASK